MEECHPRFDFVPQECVDQMIVKIDTGRTHGTGTVGYDARPGDRKSIRPDAQRRHEGDVLFDAVVVIAGHGSVRAVQYRPGPPAVRVPDRRPAVPLADGALDLIRRRGNAPRKVRREGVVRRPSGGEQPLIDGVPGGRIVPRQVHAHEDQQRHYDGSRGADATDAETLNVVTIK